MSSLHLSLHAKHFRAPEYCMFETSNSENLTYDAYRMALIKKGIVLITLNFADITAKVMNNIVLNIGEAHEHDSLGRTVWDVRIGGETGEELLAISHSDKEFSLHNDGAFESKMPGYFGLYVVHADQFGGGINILVSSDRIIENLSDQAFKILSKNNFKIRVPTEFRKEVYYIESSLIDANHYLRYRHDIIDRSFCSQEELEALTELELQLSLPQNMLKVSLNKGQILLLDNRRFLHARTKIKDPKRHLRRIRFNMNEISRVA